MRLRLAIARTAASAFLLLALPAKPSSGGTSDSVIKTDAAHRVAILSWSSAGARGKIPLPGPRGDAASIGQVLHELGGVASNDILRLDTPDSTSLLAAFRDAADRFRADSAAGIQSVLLYYHAGHANPRGLELGDQLLPWARLREAVSSTNAKIRVAVVDACASGSLLRARGGRFTVPVPAPVQGEAWILSSRAEEASLETDSDGGGIFTRILLGGLRGAADADHDGQVTFDESFRHVSAGVRERARALGVAPQTPQWSSSLEGDRPLVLTRIGPTGSLVEIHARRSGILLSDSSNASEAWIPPDTVPTRVALPPGLHTAWMLDPDGRKAHRFLLAPGETRRILSAEFVPTDGASRPPPKDTVLRAVPVNFGLLSPLTLNGDHPDLARNNFSFDLVLGDAGEVRGFQMAGILTRVRRSVHGAQVASVVNLTQGDVVGFQMASVNLLGGGATGAQIGHFLNLDEGDSRGAQIATLMNVNRGDLTGAQISLASCYAGDLRGGQISLVNVARTMTGAQVGLVNIARDSRGLQAGLVNISMRSAGTAIGLVNVAPRSRTLAVGVANIGQDMSVHPVVGISDDGRPQMQIRYQTSWWRSLVLAESPWAHGLTEPDVHRWGLGVGASSSGRIAFGVDALLLNPEIWSIDPEPAIQANAEWRIAQRIAPGIQLRWRPEEPEGAAAFVYLAI